jgi:hypothetical protein
MQQNDRIGSADLRFLKESNDYKLLGSYDRKYPILM